MMKASGVLALAALAAGAMVWLNRAPQTAPVPLSQVQGSSFDVPLKILPPEPRSEPLVPRVDPVAVLQVELKAPEPVAPAAKPEPAPPPAAPKRAPPPEPVAAPVDDKPLSLTFARLAFRYWPQPKDKAAARDPFPKEIRALAGRKVTIDGFMFPIDFEKGKVRSFLLSNGMFGCCFGDAPQLQETIKVFRTDGKLMPYQATARVTGVLEVGEEFDGDGYVDSVFRIRAEAVVEAPSNH